MPFVFISDPYARMIVASDDEVTDFNDLLDAHEDDPARIAGELRRYLRAHPDHTDAVAHLLLSSDDPVEQYLLAKKAAQLLATALSAYPGRPEPLSRSQLDNRPVLRLVKNATLAAWATQFWSLADELVEAYRTIDPSGDAIAIAADIAIRRPLVEAQLAEGLF